MKKVAIVGVEGSGKTVLMAAMGERYRKPQEDGFFLYAKNQKTAEYCAKQIDLLRNKHTWPDATSPDSLVALEWTLMRHKGKGVPPEEVCSVEFLDFAGEVYRHAFGKTQEETLFYTGGQFKRQIDVIKTQLAEAEAIVVLVNLADIINAKGNFQKSTEMEWLSQRVFDYVFGELKAANAALVFTQKDLYSETIKAHGGLDGTFEEYLPTIFYRYESQITTFAVTAVNKVAPDARGRIVPAANFKPEGLGELMQWMFSQDCNNQNLSIRRYEEAAKKGNADAQFELGQAFDQGVLVAQNYQRALYWYKEAAEQNNAWAQNNIGVMYYKGKGVDKDYRVAFQWFLKAANQRLATAQHNLGIAYRYGNGVDKNIAKAEEWFQKAVDNGCKDAKKSLESLRKENTQNEYKSRIDNKTTNELLKLQKKNVTGELNNTVRFILFLVLFFVIFSVIAVLLSFFV